MKGRNKRIAAILWVLLLLTPAAVYADDIPVLQSVSFSGAAIEGTFRSDVFSYNLILEDINIPPQLESYQLQGDGNLFVTYDYDDTNHQTAVLVTVEYASGSAIYTFRYKNAAVYAKNSENHLDSITCTLGELVPEMNDEDTSYKLYIPSDLTQLMITPVTRDTNAYCAPVEMVLSEEQEPVITLPVTASDGSVRTYELKVRRVDKTVEQVRAEMMQEDYTSFVDGTRFYQQTDFLVIAAAAAGGILVLIVLFFFTRRFAAKVYDSEEPAFYKEN